MNEADKTAAGYKTNYEACYTASDSGCNGKTTSSEFSGYTTCVAKCDMPDYSYSTIAGAQILKYGVLGLVALVLCLWYINFIYI